MLGGLSDLDDARRERAVQRSRLSKAGFVCAALIAAFALVAGLARSAVDLERFEPALESALSRAVGLPVTIRGAVHIGRSWVPTLSVERLAVGGADHGLPSVEVDRIKLVLELRPLLQRRIVVREVALADVVAWLPQDIEAGLTRPVPAAERADGKWGRGITELHVGRVTVTDARIAFETGRGEAETLYLDTVELTSQNDALALAAAGRIRGRPVTAVGALGSVRAVLDGRFEAMDLDIGLPGLTVNATGQLGRHKNGTSADLRVTFRVEDAETLARSSGLDLSWAAGLSGSAGLRAHPDGGLSFDGVDMVTESGNLRGRAALNLHNEIPRLEADVETARFDLTGLRPHHQAPADAKRLVPDVALPDGMFEGVEVLALVSASELLLPIGPVRDVEARLSVTGSRFEVSDLTAAIADGQMSGALTLDVAQPVPRLYLHLSGKRLSLDVLRGKRSDRRLDGGRLSVDLELDGTGPTTRAIAASGDGRVRLDLRDARITHAGAAYASGDLLVTLIESFTAPADDLGASRLECAVADFPIEDGRLESQTAIGFMTDTLSVSGGGYVDLKDETLSLSFDPKPREGIGLSAAGFVDFVRLEGTLRDPRPVTDARGLASVGVRTGAAVATGGLTLLAEALFDHVTGEDDACERASRGNAREQRANVESRKIPPEPPAEITGPSASDQDDAVEGTVRKLEAGLDSLFGL